VEAAKAVGRSFKLQISYASAKNCKRDDSTAQGNIKGWDRQTNQRNTNEYTKYKPRLNAQKALGPTGLYELVLVAVHMENFRCTA